MVIAMSCVITACGTGRDNRLVDGETGESYVEAGPMPDREVQGVRLAPEAVADRLADTEHRAWSSPIFVDFEPGDRAQPGPEVLHDS